MILTELWCERMSAVLRFVILEHDHPFVHWDLMLETGETLETWRLLSYPQPGRWVDAERLPAHRSLYLDYEGPVSNDRGTVKRIVAGDYCEPHDLRDPLNTRELALQGWRLASRAELRGGESTGFEWRFA